MAPPTDTRVRLGVAAGVASAFGYAITILCGSNLAKDGLDVSTVLSIRFGVSGLILVALCLVRRASPVPVRREWLSIFLLGAIGYMVESSFFFSGLARGSAAAVTLIFYVYPALVTLVEAVRSRRRPTNRVVGTLAFSVGGCALVAGAGGRVDIAALGVVFALCSAVTFASFVTIGSRISEQSDAMVTGAWIALGASASFSVRAIVGEGYAATAGHWPVLLGNGAANALAFWMMFTALGLLGPARASVVLTLEAVFTVILATTVLHESITAIQLVGAVAVLAAAVSVAAASTSVVAEPEVIPAP